MNTGKLLITTALVAGMLSGCASHEATVYFKSGSKDISSEYKMLIKDTANIAKNHNYNRIKIMGYSDRVGSTLMNDELAAKRVNAVDALLRKNGIDESKVKRATYGERWSHWFRNGKDEQDNAAMRRVDIKVYRH